ncbi:MAG TPA: TatD family hydrolase [Caulobacterales bacterium]|nr:TatD family hydrolase [Caulobacterales bacterium]
MLIDSHVNLHSEAFAADREAVIARARAAGVVRMVTICDRLASVPAVLDVAEAHDDIWASIGQHPHNAKEAPDILAEDLIELAAHPRVCAIGETGLDRHYNLSPVEQQVASLRAHIGAARALDLPLIVHTREADDLMGDVLEEEAEQGAFRLLMHCYTSGENLARRALALGAYFSLSGILTFKAAHDVRAVARQIPLDRIILETDCPYLAPVPHRGRRCEPAFIADIYAFFCAERELALEQGAAIVADNFFRLFHTIPR